MPLEKPINIVISVYIRQLIRFRIDTDIPVLKQLKENAAEVNNS